MTHCFLTHGKAMKENGNNTAPTELHERELFVEAMAAEITTGMHKDIARRVAAASADSNDITFRMWKSGYHHRPRDVKAWMTADGRVISDEQKQQALRDGGASASSVRPYSMPLGPCALQPGDLVRCGACENMTPYTPPYPPDQCLCDECDRIVGEMREAGEL